MAEKTDGLSGILSLKGIELVLKLGANDFELLETRRVPVDINRTGVLMERGAPVVDYSGICSILDTELGESYRYIEELALHILELLETRWPGGWRITVHKIQPPVRPSADSASVTVESP